MPITSITSDPDALTLTVVADYPVSIERLWAAWTDPSQLERFWGPPEWPATFTSFDLRVGGRATYHMTGPSGEFAGGFWIFEQIEAPRCLAVRDGFVHEDGTENVELPGTRMRIDLSSTPEGSRFVCVSRFASLQDLEQLVAMGMLEGLRAAMGQLDAVLDDRDPASQERAATLEMLGDTRVAISRIVRAPLREVWRAHREPSLVKRWMLGPDGWSMPVCELASGVGDSYRYEWENAADGQRFGFEGELVAREEPRREVVTERMIGVEDPGTVNELLLEPLPGGRTRIVVTIDYPSPELRQTVIDTGMVGGMELSYARLERVLAQG